MFTPTSDLLSHKFMWQHKLHANNNDLMINDNIQTMNTEYNLTPTHPPAMLYDNSSLVHCDSY